MADQRKVELNLTIIAQDNNLRQLRDMRLNLYSELEKSRIAKELELEQASDTRSLDPAVIGAIGIVFLPMFVEKLSDVLIDLIKKRDCTVTIKVPVQDAEPVEISYNPQYVSDKKLKEWIAAAVQMASAATG